MSERNHSRHDAALLAQALNGFSAETEILLDDGMDRTGSGENGLEPFAEDEPQRVDAVPASCDPLARRGYARGEQLGLFFLVFLGFCSFAVGIGVMYKMVKFEI